MRKVFAFAFVLTLSVPGCFDEKNILSPTDPDSPLNVSGIWMYEGKAVTYECNPSFCSECHGGGDLDVVAYYQTLSGVRTIWQEGEELIISDHIVSEAMGTEMHGTIKVYGGEFRCGGQVVDESETTITITDYGKFHSNDHYSSILSLSSSRDGTVFCKVAWSITGRRAD